MTPLNDGTSTNDGTTTPLNKVQGAIRSASLVQLMALQREQEALQYKGFHPNHNVLAGQFVGNTRNFQVSRTIIFKSAKYFNPVTQSYYWECCAGNVVDGASIPKWAWSIVGAPYSGKYRLSASIHDMYCPSGWEQNTEAVQITKESIDPDTVHGLFAEMIKAEGVKGWRYYAMKWAVLFGGPRW